MFRFDWELTLVLRHERTIRKNFKGAGNCRKICRKFTKNPLKVPHHFEILEKNNRVDYETGEFWVTTVRRNRPLTELSDDETRNSTESAEKRGKLAGKTRRGVNKRGKKKKLRLLS